MITVISELFYPKGGGAEIVTYNILSEIVHEELDNVTIISGTPQYVFKDANNVKYIHEPMLKHSQNKFYLWSLSNLIIGKYRDTIANSHVIYIPGILYNLLPLVRKVNKNADVVVHLHNYQVIKYSQFYINAKTSKELYKEDVFLLRKEYGKKSYMVLPLIPLVKFLLNKLINYSDRIIVPSISFKNILCNFINKSFCNRIFSIYNPINIKNVKWSSNREHMGIYVGGSKFIKGYPVAALAALKITYRDPKAKFVFLGNYNCKLFSDRLKYLGKVSHSDALNQMARARTLLFPSLIAEPCPMSILESLLLGTIPVAFDFPTIRELLANVGFENVLCRLLDIDCFIEKISYYFSLDSDEFAKLSQNIKERAKTVYNYKKSIKRILRVLET